MVSKAGVARGVQFHPQHGCQSAAYLVYLGLRKLLAREEVQHTDHAERKTLRRIFSQGVLVNLLNPKTALFFFAFLPQFADSSKGSVALQMLTLGCIFVALATLSDGLYALLSGTMGQWLKGSRRFLYAERYLAGSVYIVLAVTTALSGTGKK